jgi:hypothetical protein
VYLPLILLGLPCVAFGVWYWVLARRTPKDKLIPLGILRAGGTWITHGTAYVIAFALFAIAVLFFIEGLIL